MKCLKRYRRKDLCNVLGISRYKLNRRLENPNMFKFKDIEKLIKWGVNKDELIKELTRCN